MKKQIEVWQDREGGWEVNEYVYNKPKRFGKRCSKADWYIQVPPQDDITLNLSPRLFHLIKVYLLASLACSSLPKHQKDINIYALIQYPRKLQSNLRYLSRKHLKSSKLLLLMQPSSPQHQTQSLSPWLPQVPCWSLKYESRLRHSCWCL